eukprot:TRINITY_DN1013_c0_g1_i1.p1 TRINITY_DN1013_c0_g1~~TRINITY_DN1013_c0_g1_i1.p1  ORF type:complete len:550 (+),score=174.73 TRINITY_DN1013_c0_g1_i1:59-1708(+)
MSSHKRVPCKYGSNCTRKNPQHFIEFEHPSSTTKRICPFGASCFCRIPQHLTEFIHSSQSSASPSSSSTSTSTSPTTTATNTTSSSLSSSSSVSPITTTTATTATQIKKENENDKVLTKKEEKISSSSSSSPASSASSLRFSLILYSVRSILVSYLSGRDITALRCVCKTFASICKDHNEVNKLIRARYDMKEVNTREWSQLADKSLIPYNRKAEWQREQEENKMKEKMNKQQQIEYEIRQENERIEELLTEQKRRHFLVCWQTDTFVSEKDSYTNQPPPEKGKEKEKEKEKEKDSNDDNAEKKTKGKQSISRMILEPMIQYWNCNVGHIPGQFQTYTLGLLDDLQIATELHERVKFCSTEWLFGDESSYPYLSTIVEWQASKPLTPKNVAKTMNSVIWSRARDHEEAHLSTWIELELANNFNPFEGVPTLKYHTDPRKTMKYSRQATRQNNNNNDDDDNNEEDDDDDEGTKKKRQKKGKSSSSSLVGLERFPMFWLVDDIFLKYHILDRHTFALASNDWEPEPVFHFGVNPQSGNLVGLLMAVGWTCG